MRNKKYVSLTFLLDDCNVLLACCPAVTLNKIQLVQCAFLPKRESQSTLNEAYYLFTYSVIQFPLCCQCVHTEECKHIQYSMLKGPGCIISLPNRDIHFTPTNPIMHLEIKGVELAGDNIVIMAIDDVSKECKC